MKEDGDYISCNRCSSKHKTKNVKLPIGSFYCPSCINLGRIRSDEYLYFMEQTLFESSNVLAWKGKLTELQEKISQALFTVQVV